MFTIPLIVFGVGVVMLLCEAIQPGRRWPQVAGWWLRAAVFNLGQVGVVLLAGVAWDGWLLQHRPWSLDALGPVGGAAVGYLAISFVYYWWHRWRHQSAFLWRWFHQLHHSPQRIEVITAFYKHPNELLVNSALSSVVLYLLVGLNPAAAAGATLLSGLGELFYHWNVRTPYWLGFIVQRPESHCLHHQENVHAFNYGDLPIWDMLFGTFHNPKKWESTCGLGATNEPRLYALLLGKDVTAPVEPSGSGS